jgi:hypothetical protein
MKPATLLGRHQRPTSADVPQMTWFANNKLLPWRFVGKMEGIPPARRCFFLREVDSWSVSRADYVASRQVRPQSPHGSWGIAAKRAKTCFLAKPARRTRPDGKQVLDADSEGPRLPRAVSALKNDTPEARQELYERARTALKAEFGKLDPPNLQPLVECPCRSADRCCRRQVLGSSSMASNHGIGRPWQ